MKGMYKPIPANSTPIAMILFLRYLQISETRRINDFALWKESNRGCYTRKSILKIIFHLDFLWSRFYPVHIRHQKPEWLRDKGFATHIIIVEFACLTEVFPHTYTAIDTYLTNLVKVLPNIKMKIKENRVQSLHSSRFIVVHYLNYL